MRHILTLNALLFMAVITLAEEPWSASQRDPILHEAQPLRLLELDLADNFAMLTCYMWLGFYQNWLSVLSRSPCRMEPSCSNYAIQAIKEHGAGIGIIMTADRLIHEVDEQKARRIVRSPGKAFCPDSVSNNDFWWYAP